MERLLVIVCLFLGACAENHLITTGKGLLATKGAIVASATGIDALCRTQPPIIEEAECRLAATVYSEAKRTYDTAADSLILCLSAPSADADAKLRANSEALTRMSMRLVGLYVKYGGKP